ncbi:iron uptake protein [Cellvibrio sp. ARAG 10.3]|uniref:iron uptake protein n=1 Tax=Cellvibrio sp. ARAG 10.3 TaxID=3451358 RepID=UPI003F44C2D7
MTTQYFPVINRVAAALLGGYGFIWGFCALGIAAFAALGVSFHEAETGVMLVAFLLFLGLFLWTFAAKSMVKVWVVFVGGAVVMTGAALTIQHFLVG